MEEALIPGIGIEKAQDMADTASAEAPPLAADHGRHAAQAAGQVSAAKPPRIPVHPTQQRPAFLAPWQRTIPEAAKAHPFDRLGCGECQIDMLAPVEQIGPDGRSRADGQMRAAEQEHRPGGGRILHRQAHERERRGHHGEAAPFHALTLCRRQNLAVWQRQRRQRGARLGRAHIEMHVATSAPAFQPSQQKGELPRILMRQHKAGEAVQRLACSARRCCRHGGLVMWHPGRLHGGAWVSDLVGVCRRADAAGVRGCMRAADWLARLPITPRHPG